MTTREKIEIMQAYEAGKTIERRSANGTWHVDDCPEWDWCRWDYRVQPDPPRMSNLELARWLAEGNGQKRKGPCMDNILTYHTYAQHLDDISVDDSILIRPWGWDRWVIPSWDAIRRLDA